jgi:hypothetical protein
MTTTGTSWEVSTVQLLKVLVSWLIFGTTGLEIRETSPYISPDMLYRYCRAILSFPTEVQWAIFYLNNNGSTGRLLRQVDHNMVAPGNYVILDQGKYDASKGLLKLLIDRTDREPVAVSVTSDRAPRRVYSRSPSSSQIARDRNSLVKITKKPYHHHYVERWLNFLL